MSITPDTNILIRAVVQDDPRQSRAATGLLKEAEIIAISLTALCEFVWVLRSVYHFDPQHISSALGALLDTQNVVVSRPAAEAGLAILRAGGDFADGIIAYEGAWLGGETFVSFDKKAVALIAHQGQKSRLLT